jgi:uncharacterized membrane protein YuzA (DUF378 family)
MNTRNRFIEPARADWFALALLIAGGVVLGIDGMLRCDLLGSLLARTPTVAEGIKGLMGVAALYAIGRILLIRHQR